MSSHGITGAADGSNRIMIDIPASGVLVPDPFIIPKTLIDKAARRKIG
jgi:hypothetical protein